MDDERAALIQSALDHLSDLGWLTDAPVDTSAAILRRLSPAELERVRDGLALLLGAAQRSPPTSD
jgi:hypothetical protein